MTVISWVRDLVWVTGWALAAIGAGYVLLVVVLTGMELFGLKERRR